VWVGWAGLATGTEISIVANSALVAIALDVILAIALVAERTIAVNTMVSGLAVIWSR